MLLNTQLFAAHQQDYLPPVASPFSSLRWSTGLLAYYSFHLTMPWVALRDQHSLAGRQQRCEALCQMMPELQQRYKQLPTPRPRRDWAGDGAVLQRCQRESVWQWAEARACACARMCHCVSPSAWWMNTMACCLAVPPLSQLRSPTHPSLYLLLFEGFLFTFYFFFLFVLLISR